MIRYVLRPCWAAGLVWLITSLACPWLPAGGRVVLMALSVIVLAVALCVPAVRRVHAIPLFAAVCLLAAAAYQIAFVRRVEPTEACVGQPVSLEVQVMESGSYALLEVQSGELPQGTQIVFYPSDEELVLETHDRFTATFILEVYGNESLLSRLMRRAYGSWLRVRSVEVSQIEATLAQGAVPWTDIFVQLRNRLVAGIEQHLHGDVAAVTTGICYGVDDGLSAEAVSAFRTGGVSHLFAVSGLHMAVLLQGLMYLLRRLRVRRVGRSVIGAVLLLGFMALVGFSASVVRAGAVSLVVLFGECLRRRADSRNSLGLALLILLLPDPFAAYDAGLLLSFAATYGLLCWTGPIRRLLLCGREPKRFAKLIKAVVGAVAVSLAATLATVPVLAIYFSRVSLLSVPVNLLTTLPAEAVLITGCVSSLFSAIGLSALAQPLLLVAGLMSRYVLWICEKFSAFSLATVATSTPFLLLWLVGVYVLALTSGRALDRQGLAALCGVCVCILCAGQLLYRGTVYHTLRATNASDEAVVVSYHGSTVVVTAPGNVATLYAIADALDTFGTAHIDALFLIGGEEPVVSYIPLVLDEYLTEGTPTVYSNLPWVSPPNGVSLEGCRVRLGNELVAHRSEDRLLIDWGGRTLVITAGSDFVILEDDTT